jgi:uncharacterized protein (DUF488 family)
MSASYPVYTIGHSSQPIESFIAALQQHGIETVADLRSTPYSSRYPHFAREALQKSLIVAGIRYLFLGRELGARRDEPDCYVGDCASYDEIAKLPNYLRGIGTLVTNARQRRIALMCSEQDPIACHRTILVGRELARQGVELRHIGSGGSLETHREAEQRVIAEELGGQDQPDLFPGAGDHDVRLQQAYSKRAQRIAYRRNSSRERTS